MHESYILLVDDNKSIRDCLIWVLEEEGYTVFTATNGQEALEVLAAKMTLPAIILLDLMMPVMNGWQFREIQQLDLKYKTIPTLILSAKNNVENQSFYANESFLPKPFSIEDLLEVIKEQSH